MSYPPGIGRVWNGPGSPALISMRAHPDKRHAVTGKPQSDRSVQRRNRSDTEIT